MKNLSYSIEFHSLWHCGSGLSAGADIDTLVIKDDSLLPYVPGKTVKGILREAVEDYAAYMKLNVDSTINSVFGHLSPKNSDDIIQGDAFFTNAELSKDEQNYIKASELQEHLYKAISSTKIDNEGIAEDHSLRRIEATIPCVLYGKILNVDDKLVDVFKKAVGLVKRIGLNRNRGLGRCTINIWEE